MKRKKKNSYVNLHINHDFPANFIECSRSCWHSPNQKGIYIGVKSKQRHYIKPQEYLLAIIFINFLWLKCFLHTNYQIAWDIVYYSRSDLANWFCKDIMYMSLWAGVSGNKFSPFICVTGNNYPEITVIYAIRPRNLPAERAQRLKSPRKRRPTIKRATKRAKAKGNIFTTLYFVLLFQYIYLFFIYSVRQLFI